MAKASKETKKSGVQFSGLTAACAGLALTGLGIFMLLSFATFDPGLDPLEAAKTCWTGLLGAYVAFGGIHTVGIAPAYCLAFLVMFWGMLVTRKMHFFATWPHVIGGVFVVAALSLGSCAFADTYDMDSGGLFAVYVSPPAILYFGRWGLVLASAGLMLVGVLLAFGEAAVYGVHSMVFRLRDIMFGFANGALRLKDLCKMLFQPRLAVAGPSVADASRSQRSATASAAPKETPAAVETETSANKRIVKDWKPREQFTSRFLDLDFADRNATAISEPVRVAIAPEPASGEKKIIMDVEAEAEESDTVETIEPAPIPEPVIQPVVFEENVDDEEEEEDEFLDKTETRSVPEPLRPIIEASQPKPYIPPAAPVEQRQSMRPGAFGQEAKPAQHVAPAPESDLSEYRLPPIELLDPPEPPVVEDRALVEGKAKILEQTLAEFKIDGRVVHIERGPRVTMYEISLAPGIRLNKVTSLADNIAMQLQAESVRIIAPIPGKNTIGIEIPNTCKELVSLREIVLSVNREKRRQALPVCLGKDVSGSALVADLAKMPHLLIAGATGSGKSVCINSIILSIMMCCRPDETQMIMVDPKVVELSRFKDIPHLMSPVITDMKRAVSVLEWICQKMDERYEQMSQVSVNNIAKFNALGEEGIRTRLDAFASLEEIEAFPKKMPYMVVIIDELADLMMVAGKEVEQHITRLAAKSRAVGIHLILATQRPSVDVITGLIKANMPCRIAFQVASRVDSRTILDGNGAETLLGQGDMLYLPPGVGKLTRAQGVYVSDEELFRVVDFTKAEAEPQYHSDLLGPVIGGGGGAVDISSFDELFMSSGVAIIENQRGSVSLLQRKFGIGYGRASRIIDQLASVGLLGPFRDGKAREILLTMEEFQSKFGNSDIGYDDGDGSMAGLRDDEMERDQAPWDDED